MSGTTHVCLVSDQPLANLLPAIGGGIVRRVILVVSPQMRPQADSQACVLRKWDKQVEVLELPGAYDMAAISAALEAWLTSQSEPNGIWLNATGGTKPMAMAAQEVFRRRGLPVFYMTPNGEVSFIAGSGNGFKVHERLRLDTFVTAHGWSVDSREPVETDVFLKRHADLIDWLGMHAVQLAPELHRLKRILSGSSGEDARRLPAELRRRLEATALMRFDGPHILCHNPAMTNFLSGTWLERYVFRQVQALDLAHDLALSLKVAENRQPGHKGKTASPEQNELDVALLHDNRLYAIECKTVHDPKQYVDFLYKLAFQRRLGGATTQVAMVALTQVSAALGQRAKNSRIAVFGLDQIADLRSHLLQWIA